MVVDADERMAELLRTDPEALKQWEENQKLDEDPRITCLGLFLRKTSFDEIPQFVNVLMGDMSVVGPRPIVENEIDRYGPYFSDYASMKPGITGLWQVSGRSDVSYEDRVALDVEYSRTKSFAQDVKIILKTVKVVLTRDGAC